MLDTMMLVFGAWDPSSALDGLIDWLKNNGAKFLTVLGIICILFAGIYLFRTVVQNQGKGKFVMLAVVALIVGGVLATGGIAFLTQMSEGGYDGVKDVGGIIAPPQLNGFLSR